ncbi:hypothetical protein AR687_21290 [Flavobacteriaceae bacterium CRH]|nr:hypothetical protein AR687_21290 [Flavobacteriaceae bacterium CRH]
MSDNKLNLIPVLEKGQSYDASTGTLTLNKEGVISVTIKQYKEDKKRIEALEKKKKDTLEYSRQKWEQHAKEGWSKKKLQENYDANMQESEKLDKESRAILDKYENVNWCWQLVGNKLDYNKLSHNESLLKGIADIKSTGTQNVSFPAFLVGGGMAWLEAFHEKEGAVGKTPYGIYVKAKGIPKILRTEWTDFEYQPIVGSIGFMSKVILHIYTSGMYGQEVEIELNDKDLFTRNDKLSFSGKATFDREVNILKIKKNDIGKVAISGLLHNGRMTADKKEQYIQKIEVEVLVDATWEKQGGKILEIFPRIKSYETDTYFEDFDPSYLNVEEKSLILTAVKEVSNNVAVVGAVETNESAFHHCRYDLIKASYSKKANSLGNQSLEVELFNSNKEGDKIKSKLIMPVIAGVREGRRELKITLDSNTDECRFEDDKEKTHKGRVINLSQIHDAIVIEESTRVNEHKIYDKNEFKIGNEKGKGIRFGKEEEGHIDTDDDNEISNTHTKYKNSVSGLFGISRESKTTLFENKQVRGLYPNSDTEIILDIGYDYGDESISSLLKYRWPLSKKNLQHYPIILQTCCFTKQLDITVFPDIKWILQFAYDCDPEEFQDMRKEKYDEYLVRVEKLDDKVKPQKLDEKIRQLDAEIAQANQDASRASGKKKDSYKKLITKLEKLKIKNKNRKERYKDNKKKEQKVYKKDRPDLFSFKENVESGLSDLVVSLHAEYDRPGEAVEVSGSYKQFVNLVKQLTEVTQMIDLILDGKKKSQKKLDKKFIQIDEEKAKKQLEAIGDALKGRSLFSKNLIPPSLAVLGSWYAENPKDINISQVGIVGEIQVLAKPLIGAEISMDFLALAQRAHPIARGLITLIDFSEAVGVGPKITLEIEISGQIEIEGKFRCNSASETSNFNQKSLAGDAEDDSPLTASGVFGLEIRGKIEFSKKANSYIFGSVVVFANAGFEVKTGITLSGAIKADEHGFFIDPLLTFHGLTVVGIVEAGYKVENSDGGEYSSGSTNDSFELVLMNEYEGSFEDSEGKKIQFYLN